MKVSAAILLFEEPIQLTCCILRIDVCQQMLDLYIAINYRGDVTHLTKIKIALNEQAQLRGPDKIMDDVTKEEVKLQTSEREFDGVSNPLDVVNTNQHTVSYHFSTC